MAAVLSEKQTQLLAAVCEVMKADIDWNKVAEIADMNTAKYARDTWAIVRTKLTGGKKPAAKLAKHAKATSKKRKAADVEEGGDDEEALTVKKTKSCKKKEKPAPQQEECGVKKEEASDDLSDCA